MYHGPKEVENLQLLQDFTLQKEDQKELYYNTLHIEAQRTVSKTIPHIYKQH